MRVRERVLILEEDRRDVKDARRSSKQRQDQDAVMLAAGLTRRCGQAGRQAEKCSHGGLMTEQEGLVAKVDNEKMKAVYEERD